MKSVRLIVPVIAMMLVCFASIEAQEVEQVVISNADALFPEPFSLIAGLRELGDGRLIVSDGVEQIVGFIDFETGSFQKIGREGAGPGEYRLPGVLLPLPGNSTLLSDAGNMRMSVIDSDGRITRSFPLLRSDGLFLRPSYVDSQGLLYFQYSNMVFTGAGAGSPENPDSVPIGRWNPVTDVIDTVCYGSTRGRERTRLQRGDPNPLRRFLPTAFAARDAWVATPDGQIAVVHADDYHVEWHDANGRRTVGPNIDYVPVSVTRHDKEAWLQEQSTRSVMMVSGEPGGGSRTTGIPIPEVHEIDWPDVKPPFRSGSVRTTPRGELWVGRYMRAGEAPTFDVVDDTGRRVREMVLPNGRRLVGFGNGIIYMVFSDEDDLQWLERYTH